jgi:hypothetical protein
VLVRKTRGRLSGWLGYTLSRTRRKIPAINGGRSYPSRYDHTHDLSLVGVYHLGERTLVSLNWVWATGDAVTFPGGRYVVDEHIASYYTERNSYRMPDYHRLDLACTWRLWKRGEREGNLNLSLYNAYGRRNAYAIDFRQNENDPTRLEAVRMALFTFVPSVSFSFRF